jgi:hypothetical protein
VTGPGILDIRRSIVTIKETAVKICLKIQTEPTTFGDIVVGRIFIMEEQADSVLNNSSYGIFFIKTTKSRAQRLDDNDFRISPPMDRPVREVWLVIG